MELFVKLIVFLPLAAALLVGLNTSRLTPKQAQGFTTISTAVAAILSWIVFINVLKGATYHIALSEWVVSGNFVAEWKLRVDVLTAIMLTLVTTVSSLVHLYSIGYMSHDEHPQRFMAYLSLFTFFMLMLVTSDNLLQVFFGWEGVGLASYLLIGFWYKKHSASSAAMKAFLVNRVGDFGLALGLFAAYILFGTISFDNIFSSVAGKTEEYFTILGHQYHAITLVCVLLFIGCMGKSAQLGLHTWLPDAMEGPTPVSALIHAATMVTAGIFLVARMSPVFEYSPAALHLVTFIGATTCIFAATIALTQNDIKRIIAYSTCSQLGYMFFACGVSAYGAGIFHLYTHGFFKALLFLSAGSVIHAMSDEQDIRNMGGIWKKIPLTYAMMMIGTLAITGFPLLSGFYSKDIVLETAYASGAHGNFWGRYAFWVGLITAGLTAFYSWRLIFLTFHGSTRADRHVIEHIHESPKVMTVPLIILAIGAVFAGGILAHKGITSHDLSFWNGSIAGSSEKTESLAETADNTLTLAPSEREAENFNVYEAAEEIPAWVKFAPLYVGAAGFIIAFLLYLTFPHMPARIAKEIRPLYMLSYRKWYFDEIYNYLFVRPAKLIGLFFSRAIDQRLIDRFGPNGFARTSDMFGIYFRKLQTGYIYHYSFVMMLGLIVMLTYLLVR